MDIEFGFESRPSYEESDNLSDVPVEAVPHIPYPVALHTVDIAVLSREVADEGYLWKILLGRKSFSDKFQFFGGFLDPGETAEQGASRELKEECGLEVSPYDLNYLGSFFIDDGRYRNSVHKITTSAFYTIMNECKECQGQDDIVQAKWFDYNYIRTNYKKVVEPLHWEIIEKLNKIYSLFYETK